MYEPSNAYCTYEMECGLEQLGSLLLVLIDQTEAIGAHVDPGKAAKIAADVARIAHDCLSAVVGRLDLPIQAIVA